MIKKMRYLIFVFFCINTIFTSPIMSLNQQEIVDEILDMYKRNHTLIPRKDIDQFLEEKNLSIEQLYKILQKKNNFLSPAIIKINRKILSMGLTTQYRSPVVGASVIDGIVIIASLGFTFLSATLLTLGSVVNRSASSTAKKILSYGLNTLGATALIPEIFLEANSSGFITKIVLPTIYTTVIPNHVFKKIDDLEWTIGLIHYLELLYPELNPQAQPTSP